LLFEASCLLDQMMTSPYPMSYNLAYTDLRNPKKYLCSSKLQLFAGYASSCCGHFLQGLIVRD
jgi:hypothetical protein